MNVELDFGDNEIVNLERVDMLDISDEKMLEAYRTSEEVKVAELSTERLEKLRLKETGGSCDCHEQEIRLKCAGCGAPSIDPSGEPNNRSEDNQEEIYCCDNCGQENAFYPQELKTIRNEVVIR